MRCDSFDETGKKQKQIFRWLWSWSICSVGESYQRTRDAELFCLFVFWKDETQARGKLCLKRKSSAVELKTAK